MNVLGASLGAGAAVLVPVILSIFSAGFLEGPSRVMFVLLFAVLYVVMVVPAFRILDRLNLVGWCSSLVAGLLGGAIPWAAYTWPYYTYGKYSSTINGVPHVIAGVPTAASWFAFGSGVFL